MGFVRRLRLAGLVGTAVFVLASCIRFAPPEALSVDGGAALADVTGDGTADILANDPTGIARYEYCGTACLDAKEVIANEHIRFVGDFNNDGKDDVIAIDDSVNFELLPGSATGLSAASAIPIPRPSGYTIVKTGDFNGDGKVDLLWSALVFNGYVHYFAQLGNGAGAFTSSSFGTITPTFEAGPEQVEVGDTNNDGRDDLIAAAVGQIQVMRYGGRQCDFGGLPVTCSAFSAQIPSDHFAVGDIDADGRADIARYRFSTHTVDFFRSTGDGFTAFPYDTFATATSSTTIEMGLRDIDNDGAIDFLLNDRVNPRTWWSGTNDGGFPFRALSDVPLGASGCAQCFGDVNGDARLDAIVDQPSPSTRSDLWINASTVP